VGDRGAAGASRCRRGGGVITAAGWSRSSAESRCFVPVHSCRGYPRVAARTNTVFSKGCGLWGRDMMEAEHAWTAVGSKCSRAFAKIDT
jgi:hypothetical protein